MLRELKISSFILLFLLSQLPIILRAQTQLWIRDKDNREPVPNATITNIEGGKSYISDRRGHANIEFDKDVYIIISATGFGSDTILVSPATSDTTIFLVRRQHQLDEVVITGTMKAIQRTASPVPVEVYTSRFFIKNPTPSLFDAMQMINGVRPQLNCSVCNTGDIHMNGLEGPYTMVLIDGMPIVSSLASVYGLSGIPNAMVERVEIVKGPASSLYGSEAIGGLINVITKNPLKAPRFSIDLSATSWKEMNADIGVTYRITPMVNSLFGLNYYRYDDPRDENGDNFTDVTLQHRISLFNKFQFNRNSGKLANLAIRYNYEDRWGGEMQWNKSFRGTDSVYGESIYTSRVELIGNYQLPVHDKLLLSYSYNYHSQRSVYGNVPYNALQNVFFSQLTYEKQAGSNHELLFGAAGRSTSYDDNSTATFDTLTGMNKVDRVFIPAIFVQDEIAFSERKRLLLGLRYDYDSRHGSIFTPRIALKLGSANGNILRINAGTGFRVVNIFTEDHAALTGARAVVISEELKPEKSYNLNLNYAINKALNKGFLNIDFSAWYTYFSNRIVPDYETNPNQIIYRNLTGYAESKGISANAELSLGSRFRMTAGATLMDVSIVNKDNQGVKERNKQLLTENWTGTWTVSYSFPKPRLVIDYTGNIYGPMELPLLSATDPRPGQSPVWSIQNIQLTKKMGSNLELYAGIKNLLDWTPAKSTPFLIARANDPFDKQVQYDNNGQVIPTANNPYALSFDPNYVYAPNQGMRFFAGLRLQITSNK